MTPETWVVCADLLKKRLLQLHTSGRRVEGLVPVSFGAYVQLCPCLSWPGMRRHARSRQRRSGRGFFSETEDARRKPVLIPAADFILLDRQGHDLGNETSRGRITHRVFQEIGGDAQAFLILVRRIAAIVDWLDHAADVRGFGDMKKSVVRLQRLLNDHVGDVTEEDADEILAAELVFEGLG